MWQQWVLRFDTIAEQLQMTASRKRCARSILRNLPLLFLRENGLLHKKNNCLSLTNICKSVIFRPLDQKRSNVTIILNSDFTYFTKRNKITHKILVYQASLKRVSYYLRHFMLVIYTLRLLNISNNIC